MFLLSIDTSGKSGGVTLAEDAENTLRVLESAPIAGGTFSAQLVPTVAALLQKYSLVPADLGGFVAVSGPGSFTGLRVGLSAIKGLAEALKRPIATVSLLEALAALSGHEGRIATVLDASRGEAYFGVYQVVARHGSRILEQWLSHAEFANKITGEASDAAVTSDESIVKLAAAAGRAVQKIKRPGAEEIASIGWRKLLAGNTAGVEELDANYIRRSDAEIFSSGDLKTFNSNFDEKGKPLL